MYILIHRDTSEYRHYFVSGQLFIVMNTRNSRGALRKDNSVNKSRGGRILSSSKATTTSVSRASTTVGKPKVLPSRNTGSSLRGASSLSHLNTIADQVTMDGSRLSLDAPPFQPAASGGNSGENARSVPPLGSISVRDLRFDIPSVSNPNRDPATLNIHRDPRFEFPIGPNSTENPRFDQPPDINLQNNSRFDFPSGSNLGNVPRFENSSGQANNNSGAANAPVSMETLMALMEQSMRQTRAEIRRELSSVRENNTNRSFNSQATQDLNEGSNIKLEKWKISYNGTGSVSDFLFKVETLCSRTRCSNEHLLSNFHVLLEGRAETWYWFFMRKNPNATFSGLRHAIIKEFGLLETDHDIIFRMHSRRQQLKETYDSLHTAIVSMNLRLENPLPDHKIIDILKKNSNERLKPHDF